MATQTETTTDIPVDLEKVRVKFDSGSRMWATCDEKGEILTTVFRQGILRNVTMGVVYVEEYNERLCAKETKCIGIARGHLQILPEDVDFDESGYKKFSFEDDKFRDDVGDEITECEAILMTRHGRHAVYRPHAPTE